jgi:TRAP-type C4-dicarboxylate transport system permease small subunit
MYSFLERRVSESKKKKAWTLALWINENVERYIVIFLYAMLAIVVVGDVASRVITGNQSQWGSSISIYLFIWLSWVGCSYHVKRRSHLRFGSFRKNLPRRFQAALYIFDDFLWIGLSFVVIWGVNSLISMQLMLQNLIQGTSLPLALATISIPIGWSLVIIRALFDVLHVVMDYHNGTEFETEISLNSD